MAEPERADARTRDAASTDSVPQIERAVPPVPVSGRTEVLPRTPVAPDAPDLDADDAAVYEKLKQRRAERRRRTVRRRAVAAAAIVAVLAVGAVAVHLATRQPDAAATEPVLEYAQQGTYSTTVDGKGTLEPLSSTVVTPEVEGTIAELRVQAGQTVAAGDVVMVIKNDELDRAIDDAARSLRAAKADQQAAYDSYNAAVDAYNAAAADGDASATAPEQSPLTAADRAVETAQVAYDQAVAEGAKRTVTAASAGSVVALNAQVGAAVGGSSQDVSKPLVQIADLSQMKVTVQVDEESIAHVAKGQAASVTFAAFPDLVLDGTVTGIASIATNAGGDGSYYGESSSATFAVDVLIPKPDPRLKPGMTASVALTTERMDDVVMVPVTALMTDDGQSHYVNVETDAGTHAYERRDVTVVTKNDDYAVVGRPEGAEGDGSVPTAPVADGDVLVVSGGGLDASSMDGVETFESGVAE